MRPLRLAALVGLLAAATALVAIWVQATRPVPTTDPAPANALAQAVAADWHALEPTSTSRPPAGLPAGLEYTVVDAAGRVVLQGPGEPVGSELAAVRAGASALAVTVDGARVGTVYVRDAAAADARDRTRVMAWTATAALVAAYLAVLVVIGLLQRRVVGPFTRLRSFATDVAAGDLDAPLAMERGNAFGAFTEAFDLLRTELGTARAAEAAAQESKRALVAELGHDIRTPVAAVAASAEVLALDETDPRRLAGLETIRARADQVIELVEELFRANDDELARLTVEPREVSSRDLAAELTRMPGVAGPVSLPDALLQVDPHRWRQVVDNVLANAAKYAGTPVEVSGAVRDGALHVTIRDRGPGPPEDELESIVSRGIRGSNVGRTTGLGLGLHIAAQLMARMGGGLETAAARPGLAVVLSLPLAR